ncbi:MAG: acyltransferase [Thermoleophilaceae bacterium]|nr:acyltransferase [Thermoleophilaceae bacterium]
MTSEASTPTVSRAQGIDVTRALAALSVLTYHVWLYGLPNPNRPTREGWASYALFEMRVGLVVFFVLSGYLLYRPLLRRDGGGKGWHLKPLATGTYYRRRVLRIVPAYYLAIIGSVVLLWGLDGTPGVRLPEASQLWLFFIFAQNYNPQTLLTLDAPTWTLAVQAAFYAVFPLLIWFARPLGRRMWLMPIALIMLGVAWNAYTFNHQLGAVARLALPAMMPYMALGMLAAHWPARSRRDAWLAIGFGVVLALGNSTWHALAGGSDVLGVVRDIPGAIGFALITLGVAYPLLGSSRKLLPLESFGRWSYGIFLWHLPLLLWLQGHGLRPANGLLAWLLLVIAAAAVGALNWRFIERPMIARSRGTLNKL